MAYQTQIGHKVSFEEWEEKYAHRRYEYVDGYAVPMGPEIEDKNGELIASPTESQHGEIALEFGALLRNYVREHKLGKVYGAETGFLMIPQTREMRAADVAFVAKERLAEVDPHDWLPFPPDLAAEVISQYEKAADIRRKAQAYMENGTRLLLLIYPDSRVIDVYRPHQPIISLRPGDTLDGYDVLPGFTLDVAALFEVLD